MSEGKKTRTPKPVFVEKLTETTDVYSWEQVAKAGTVTEAEKWLKKEGDAGATYRIITVEREVKLVVESKRVASFA